MSLLCCRYTLLQPSIIQPHKGTMTLSIMLDKGTVSDVLWCSEPTHAVVYMYITQSICGALQRAISTILKTLCKTKWNQREYYCLFVCFFISLDLRTFGTANERLWPRASESTQEIALRSTTQHIKRPREQQMTRSHLLPN